MTSDLDLATNIRSALSRSGTIREVKMFGGTGFMLNGNLVAAGANWEYIRVWQITAPTASTKQITVRTQVKGAPNYSGRLPESTVVALKSNPF